MDEMLVDEFLPVYDVSDTLTTIVEADVATTWAALMQVDLMEVGRRRPLVAALGALRGVRLEADHQHGGVGRHLDGHVAGQFDRGDRRAEQGGRAAVSADSAAVVRRHRGSRNRSNRTPADRVASAAPC